jgi:nicotinate-nucleotide adenylyltransferase
VKERLGVLGGTFDPVHVGHLVAAVEARHALGLDRVLMIVANRPWQKGHRQLAPAEDRLAVLEAALAGTAGVEASRMEIDRPGDTVTADTLEQLLGEDPSRELFLIVGADVAADLHTWRRGDVCARLATLVVVSRAGAPAPPRLGEGWRVREVEMPGLAISSSEVRARVESGRPIDFLLPHPAIDLIRARGLYSG